MILLGRVVGSSRRSLGIIFDLHVLYRWQTARILLLPVASEGGSWSELPTAKIEGGARWIGESGS